VPLPDGFVLYRRGVWHPPYFDRRGITPAQAEYHGLGWVLHGSYTGADGRLRQLHRRLVVPVRFGGKVATWIGRDMTGRSTVPHLFPAGAPRASVLFDWDRARRCKQIILVEGVFDAIRVGQGGTCTFGTALSEAQYVLLAGAGVREVVVMFDSDAAGVEGTRKVVEKLRGVVSVRVATGRLPRGGDPDCYDHRTLWRIACHAPLSGSTASLMERIFHAKDGIE